MTQTEQLQANPAEDIATVENVENPFSADDLKQFAEDDAEAGRAIGKLLSLFFLYTFVVMSISCFITWFILLK